MTEPMDKLTLLLKSPQTPKWMELAILALLRMDPIDAANQADFLATAIREYAFPKEAKKS